MGDWCLRWIVHLLQMRWNHWPGGNWGVEGGLVESGNGVRVVELGQGVMEIARRCITRSGSGDLLQEAKGQYIEFIKQGKYLLVGLGS